MSMINREAAIKLILSGRVGNDSLVECPEECNSMLEWAADEVAKMPTAEEEIIRCKDCKWWDKKDESGTYGYCHAIKHSYYSRHWEISIYRTYEADFFCADAEPKEEEDEQ